MRKPPIKLSKKQKLFAREYVKDFNGTAAAERAGYSKKTSRSQGSKLLTYPNVMSYVSELSNKKAARSEIKADDVLKELGYIGFSDVRKLYDENGYLIPIEKLDHGTAHAVSGVDYDPETGHTKVRFWRKTTALDSIAKHLQMFVKRMELVGEGGEPIKTSVGLSSESVEQIKNLILGITDDDKPK